MDGRTAFGVHFASDRWPQSLYQQVLASDEYVLMAREDHPAMGRKATLSLFRSYALVSLLLPDWNDHGNLLESELRANGVERKLHLRTENLPLALESLVNSDSMMPGTQSMVEREVGLGTLPYPPELSVPDATLVMCYPRRLKNSARYAWLSQAVLEVLSGGEA